MIFTNLNTMALTYSDVCLVPALNKHSRKDADITLHTNPALNMPSYASPIFMSPMITVTSKKMIQYMANNNMFTAVHRFFPNADEQVKFVLSSVHHEDTYTKSTYNKALGVFSDWRNKFPNTVWFGVGSIKKHKNHIHTLITKYRISNFIVDLGHGHQYECADTVTYIQETCKQEKITPRIIAGNVATAEGAVFLAELGIHGIRVGIASGQACSTYIKTGFGLPMVTSIMEVREALNSLKNEPPLLIADGGIREAGDVAIAIAVGADAVMCGKLLSATSFADGKTYTKELRSCVVDCEVYYKEYYGMASREVMLSELSKSNEPNKEVRSVEGAAGLIRYLGDTEAVIAKLHENLKSSQTMAGTNNWKDFQNNVHVRRISTEAYREKMINLDTVLAV